MSEVRILPTLARQGAPLSSPARQRELLDSLRLPGPGGGDFAAHLAAAEEAGVALAEVHRPGLAFDLDTPADLARWIELGDAA